MRESGAELYRGGNMLSGPRPLATQPPAYGRSAQQPNSLHLMRSKAMGSHAASPKAGCMHPWWHWRADKLDLHIPVRRSKLRSSLNSISDPACVQALCCTCRFGPTRIQGAGPDGGLCGRIGGRAALQCNCPCTGTLPKPCCRRAKRRTVHYSAQARPWRAVSSGHLRMQPAALAVRASKRRRSGWLAEPRAGVCVSARIACNLK